MRLIERPANVRLPRPTGPRASTVPAPDLDPIDLFEAARVVGLEAALWCQPDRGSAIVGIGRAWAIEPAGDDRFTIADAAWRTLAADLTADAPDDDEVEPIVIGGLGFAGRSPAATSAWAPFGASSLVLPALAWRRRGDGSATLTTSIVPGRDVVRGAALDAADRALDADDRALDADDQPLDPDGHALGADDEASLARRWRGLIDRLRPATCLEPDSRPLEVVGERPDRAAWDRIVGMFAGAVGRGRLDKVVLARRVDVAAADDVPLDVGAALRHLARTAPESTLYAFTRDGSTFLGATPERLVRTEHRAFETVALAGSTARSSDPAEDTRLGAALLASEKDREEHAVVVDSLRASLAPIVERLTVAPTPRLLALRHVQHLMTPIAGRLRDEAGLLSLAGRLHPTPAVGGEPLALALELIAEHEGFDRGWYAGPVGWVDREGDGELVVALRCALVTGPRATLFAGCGIVADSDPQREWDESRIKLRAVGNALGWIDEVSA